MKKNNYFRRILSAVLLFLASTLAWAYDFEVDGIYYNINGDEITVEVTRRWDGYSGDIVIPSTVTYEEKIYSVTGIGFQAFEYCFSLTSVNIPESVTSIGNMAFYNCSLTSINIPNSVTSIGSSAFSRCNSLISVYIPESVTNIKDRPFSDCSSLESITVSADNPFYDSREGCNAIIEKVTNTLICGCKKTIIPDGVTSIGDYAFENCTTLTSINIPNSVTSIGKFAFLS